MYLLCAVTSYKVVCQHFEELVLVVPGGFGGPTSPAACKRFARSYDRLPPVVLIRTLFLVFAYGGHSDRLNDGSPRPSQHDVENVLGTSTTTADARPVTVDASPRSAILPALQVGVTDPKIGQRGKCNPVVRPILR